MRELEHCWIAVRGTPREWRHRRDIAGSENGGKNAEGTRRSGARYATCGDGPCLLGAGWGVKNINGDSSIHQVIADIITEIASAQSGQWYSVNTVYGGDGAEDKRSA